MLSERRLRCPGGTRPHTHFKHSSEPMKINGNEIRPGNVIEHEGSLWAAVKVQHVKPGKGGAFAQVELKNLVDGRKLNERFRSAETVERVRLEQKDYQYLYERSEERRVGKECRSTWAAHECSIT